jgi:hypothetical protein
MSWRKALKGWDRTPNQKIKGTDKVTLFSGSMDYEYGYCVRVHNPTRYLLAIDKEFRTYEEAEQYYQEKVRELEADTTTSTLSCNC